MEKSGKVKIQEYLGLGNVGRVTLPTVMCTEFWG